MRPSSAIIALPLVAALLAISCGAEPFQAAPQEGILLLTNGQILRGRITHSGDHYYVALATGEIRLKTSEVELFCLSLEDGYQRKRAALVLGDANDHLELAQWCIAQRLFGHAARELADALEKEPDHPKIPVLERRMHLAMSERDAPPAGETTQPTSLSNDELDRMVRGMPEGTVETFTHTIQPLLLNNCTGSGCHGSDPATHYSLLRIPLGRLPSRRLTQRNLHATLAQTSRAQPSASALLLMAVREHGGARTAVFKNTDALAYRQLAYWVYRVARVAPTADVAPPQAANVDRRADPLLQTLPGARAAPPSAGRSPPSGTPAVDPFDPEVFNRQTPQAAADHESTKD
ncbi:MAG TPA: hypothetical protein VHZ24_13170 [Pirellulales bacterium]|jgi:hypothetical protein|nr:hypothetical protein [Pirellulales bacterium]